MASNVQFVSYNQQTAQVLANVTIPMYFYNIIIPQMGSYFDLYPVNFDADPRACCPLHDEDTPSFRYYENTESFYCFGCQKGGNVINLHRYFAERLNGTMPSKEEAVAFLYNYFLQGKQTETTFIDQSKQKIGQEQKKSTDAEIIKFNYYRNKLEQSITFDRTLKSEIKLEFWELFDKLDVLISKNMVSAVEAEQYLKDRVKERITKDAFIQKMKPKG